MKTKEHKFVLTVKTFQSRKATETAVLCAFASRQPDGCSFYLKPISSHKGVWMDGAKAGSELAFEMAIKTLQGLQKQLLNPKTKKNPCSTTSA